MKEKNSTWMRSLALTLFVTSLCMFIMAESSYLISSRKVSQIATDYYRLVTEENSIRVSNWYTEQVAILNSNVFALEQKGVEDRDAVKQYLVNLLAASEPEYVYDIYYMYPDNVMLCGTDFDNVTEHPEINYNLRPWYVNAVAADHAVVSTAYLDTDTNKVVVTISRRVMIGGEIAGTLCMDMFITSLGDLLNGEMMPENCYGSLVDSDFRTVFHPSESFYYEDKPPVIDSCGVKNYDKLKEALQKKESGLSFTDYDGTERTFYLRELSDTGWYVVSAIDNELVRMETNSLRRSLFIVASVILAASILIEAIVRKRSLNRTIETERALERLKVEEEQRARLEEAKEKAEAANRAKSSFLFNMSHDIRTPMNAILGYTDIAINHIDEPERVNDSLKKIRFSGGHLLNLINDILEMSRIEAGKMEMVNAPLNAIEVAEGVATMSRALAATKDIVFNFKADDLKNPYIYADELHTNQVIINLVSNAIKYTRPGGTVWYQFEQISEPTDGKADYRITVKDNGIGMSEEFQKHLFESFSREHTATVSRQEGAGLGLAIVKKIVDLTGGTITVQSSPGAGSSFIVELPFKVMDAEAIEEYEASRKKDIAAADEASFAGKRVLLVEDNEMNREIATEILEEAGLVVDTAEDGALAVRKITENGAASYDFILMDIQMPVMNGYEATKAIRELPGGKKVIIIALSANAFEEDVRKSLDAGMNAHVAKPINVRQLFDTMQGMVKL